MRRLSAAFMLGAAICFVIPEIAMAACVKKPGQACWRVVQNTAIGNIWGATPFGHPYRYIMTRTDGITVYGKSQGNHTQCPGAYCDTTKGIGFANQLYCANGLPCGTPAKTNLCGTAPPGWDSIQFSVPKVLASPTAVLPSPTGALRTHVLFHMGQFIDAIQRPSPQPPEVCQPTTGGRFGSIGLDFSTDGLNWSPYSGNPVLTDVNNVSNWVTILGAPGGSVEKGSAYFNPADNKYYMMAIVASESNQVPPPPNKLACSNSASSLSYMLSSTNGRNWQLLGPVTNAGLKGPPNSVFGNWLINVDIAFDPPSGYIYMTRTYTATATYSNPLRPSSCATDLATLQYPDRAQLYRIQYGVSGAIGQAGSQWELLADIGCMAPGAAQDYQDPLNIVPDSAHIRHNGLGHVKWVGNSIVLVVGNGNHFSCLTTDPFNVYELTVQP